MSSCVCGTVGCSPAGGMVPACGPELPSTWRNECKDVSDCVCAWGDLLMWGSTDREDQEIMRRGPAAPPPAQSLSGCMWAWDVWKGSGADGWSTAWNCSNISFHSRDNCAVLAQLKQRQKAQHTLTASMPDSCMPMLTTTMVMTCQRTQRSLSRPQTETVWTEDRDRCSSCISSTSAWKFPFGRYHFRAERAERKAMTTPQKLK